MKLAILCSQFPELHETFIIREIESLRQAGFPLRIYSLKRCSDKIIHPEARPLMELTTYVPWNDKSVMKRAVWAACKAPRSFFAGLGTLLRFHRHSLKDFAKGFIILLQSLLLAEEMRRDQISHVHAHWATMPTTAACLVSGFLGCSYSFTAHAWDIYVSNPSLREKIQRASAVITCTAYNHRFLKKYCPTAKEKIHLNYHGVDMCRFLPESLDWQNQNQFEGNGKTHDSDSRKTILSIGRFVEQKGFEDFVAALEILSKKRKDFQAILIGSDGPLKYKIEKRIAESALKDFVKIHPPMARRDLLKIYHEASMFVLACMVAKNKDRDGIPNVVLEAMAMGLPVIATHVSGLPEAVIDRETGSVIRPHHPEELADIMERFLDAPNLAEVQGRKARDFVSARFDARLHMRSLVNLMSEIVPPELSRGVVLHACWVTCREQRHSSAERSTLVPITKSLEQK